MTFSCTINGKNGSSPKQVFIGIGCGISLIIITLCYGSIYYKVKQTNIEMQNISDSNIVNSNLNRQLSKRELAITKMTLLVWIGFFICFVPTSLSKVIFPMPENRDKPAPELHIAGYVIFWCSAFINPVIYIISNKHYRRALIEILWCRNSYDAISIIENDTSIRSRFSLTAFSRKST